MTHSKYRDRILALRQEGLRPTEIASRLGINVGTYYYHTNEKTRRRNIDYALAKKKANKDMALEYKGGECGKCGYRLCRQALVFQHVDPDEKDIVISGRPHAWERLKRELDKTVLLCCRCHTELHAGCWSEEEMRRCGVKPVANGSPTGRGVLPPSKRRSRNGSSGDRPPRSEDQRCDQHHLDSTDLEQRP